MARAAIATAVVVIVVAWLLWIWPTAYRYDQITVEGDSYPVRIHRFTGRAQMLTPDDGWVPMGPSSDDESEQAPGRTT
jgi:hypothetical protein